MATREPMSIPTRIHGPWWARALLSIGAWLARLGDRLWLAGARRVHLRTTNPELPTHYNCRCVATPLPSAPTCEVCHKLAVGPDVWSYTQQGSAEVRFFHEGCRKFGKAGVGNP